MGSVVRLICALVVSGLLLPQLQAQRSEKKLLSYQQAFARERSGEDGFLGRLPQIEGWVNDDYYLERRTEEGERQARLFAVNAADGTEQLHLDYRALQKILPHGFDADNSIAHTDNYQRFLFERDSDLYLLDAGSRSFHRLTAGPGREQNPRFSPDGNWVAYTREGNLYGYDLVERLEHQYTSDGSGTVYNGRSSWVYYEEILGRSSDYAAFWWSPDSSRLAFMRFDDAPVPVFPIYHADGQHGELEQQRYPKAGDPNPYVSIGVVSVEGGGVEWMDFEERADHYIAWPFWSPDGRVLTVQWMNRGQDKIRLYNCNPETGRKTLLLEESQPSWVTFFEDLHYLKNGSGLLIRSDVDGWDHLYYYSPEGRLRARLTSGPWRVTSIEAVDEAGGYVYFTGRPEKSWDEALIRVRLDGSGREILSRGEGVHRATVSPGGKYFIDTVSTLTSPSSMTLCRGDGAPVRELGESRTSAMNEYAWGKAELFTIPSGDGYELPAYWVLPPDFDAARRYPVIFNIYGGPDSGRVRNQWPGSQPHYWAQRGVITISVDHRGSGHFGKKGVSLMHRNLGKWEMHDLIAAAKWLRGKPFVAGDRIGITGSSYGGYTTMMALTCGADHFNYGIAGSSVTDWRLYDSVYTERYMDTPEENPEGYRNGAVLSWADRYKGMLRITHGTIDDNVHMQNSTQVVDWLVSNNKSFELMLYPDSRHGLLPSQRVHQARETHDFWVRHLLGGKLP